VFSLSLIVVDEMREFLITLTLANMRTSFFVSLFIFFFYTDTANTDIYTLSLHDALPISIPPKMIMDIPLPTPCAVIRSPSHIKKDRKSTRLNSSHVSISYAVFCLKKKKRKKRI